MGFVVRVCTLISIQEYFWSSFLLGQCACLTTELWWDNFNLNRIFFLNYWACFRFCLSESFLVLNEKKMCISTLLNFQAKYFTLHIFFSSGTILEKKHLFFLVSLCLWNFCIMLYICNIFVEALFGLGFHSPKHSTLK